MMMTRRSATFQLSLLAALFGWSAVASADNPFRGGNPVVIRDPEATACGEGSASQADLDLFADLTNRGDLERTIDEAIAVFRLDEHFSWGLEGLDTPDDIERPVGQMVNAFHLLNTGLLDLWTDGEGRSARLRSGVPQYANPGTQWHSGKDYFSLARAGSSEYHSCIVYQREGAEGNISGFRDHAFGSCGSIVLGCDLFNDGRHSNPAYRAGSMVHEAQHAFRHAHGFGYSDDLDGGFLGIGANDHIDADHCPDFDGADTECDNYHHHAVVAFEYPLAGESPDYVHQKLPCDSDLFACDPEHPIHSAFQTQWEMGCDLITHPGPFVPEEVIRETGAMVDNIWTFFFRNRPPIICDAPTMIRNTLPVLPASDCDQIIDCGFDDEDRRVEVIGSAPFDVQTGGPPEIELAVNWEGCSSLQQTTDTSGDANQFSFATMSLDSSTSITGDDIAFAPQNPQVCDDPDAEIVIRGTISGQPSHCGCGARYKASGELVSESPHVPSQPPPPPPPPPPQ